MHGMDVRVGEYLLWRRMTGFRWVQYWVTLGGHTAPVSAVGAKLASWSACRCLRGRAWRAGEPARVHAGGHDGQRQKIHD